MYKQSITKILFSASLLLAVSSAQATIIDENWVTFDDASGTGVAEFAVTNDTATDIFAFIVANDNNPSSSSSDDGAWTSSIVDRFSWSGTSFIVYNGGSGDTGVDFIETSSLGTFDELFGTAQQAIIYSFFNYNGNAPGLNAQALLAGTTQAGFFFSTEQLASPFVTIGQNGAIIDTGETIHSSVVPVPAAVWLFGSGLIGLAGIARRKA